MQVERIRRPWGRRVILPTLLLRTTAGRGLNAATIRQGLVLRRHTLRGLALAGRGHRHPFGGLMPEQDTSGTRNIVYWSLVTTLVTALVLGGLLAVSVFS